MCMKSGSLHACTDIISSGLLRVLELEEERNITFSLSKLATGLTSERHLTGSKKLSNK